MKDIFQSDFFKPKYFKKHVRDFFIILLGTTLVSIAVKYILDPAGLDTGGVSGLAIVVKSLTGRYFHHPIPLWVSNLVFNIPIFLFALKVDGIKSIIRTTIGFAIMTVELAVFPEFTPISDNIFLTSLFGGVLFGFGTGIILLARATTGGTDMLGNSLSHIFRHIPVGVLIQILDGSIVLLGLFAFNIENTLYAFISVYVMGKIIDKVVDRGKKAKIALIISKECDAISKDILVELDRGVTSIDGTGEYSGKGRKILACVCSNRDVPQIKDIVKERDKKAFFIVGNVSEAMGEGFVEHWS
ncbi:MAG: YitT family protein [bacterium LCO1.1]|uniref:YitT family protein n=1 Tax=Candidatus Weimeria bifida TaxID=2599074 RepID=A0A6N7IY36_9FIRM|nr:YitT family protein [Candidatus Weimeria bifida]